jgi:hypothetical protein
LEGLAPSHSTESVALWAKWHLQTIARAQKGEHPYDKIWRSNAMEDVRNALENGMVVEAKKQEEHVTLRQFVMEPQSYHTVFLVFDRPPKGKPGQA